jgi:predicted transcriptional regulator
MMEKAAQEEHLDRRDWGLLLTAMGFAPEAVSNELLQVRVPYQNYTQRLEQGVEKGILELAGEGQFRLTDKGREIAQRVILAAYARMGTLNPLPDGDLLYLVTLLQRLVNASLEAPQPPGKWSINHSRRFDPGEKAPLMIKVDQYLSDLAAYRDDAHLAAWGSLDFGGPAWEALTYIWRGEADTLETLTRKLARRGNPPEVYQSAIDLLKTRQLVREQEGNLQLTAEGREIRQKAEQVTDRYFYAPWSCLVEGENQALGDLLDKLAHNLRSTPVRK